MTVTETEISSQPDVWLRALSLVDQARAELVAPGERVLAIGCGTSAFIAASYAALRERAGVGETDAVHASEIALARRYDRVVAISRSGTTSEVLHALALIGEQSSASRQARRVGVAGTGHEPMSGLVHAQVTLPFADEASVVQTRFPTSVLALVRAALGEDITTAVNDVREVLDAPVPVELGAHDHFVFLGTGWTLGLAHEAALKIREAAQAWSESYPAMDYRHGPIAIASPRSLVTILGDAPQGLVDDIRRTGATVLTSTVDPLAQLVAAQRLAVALAAHRGLDPDHPRALSRSVILSSELTPAVDGAGSGRATG